MLKFAKVISRILFGIFFRVELVNKHYVPEKGSALICANHKSQLDMFFLGYKLKRCIHYIAKEELFRNPLLGAVMRSLGAFPVKRGSGDVKAIRTGLDLLEKGHIIGIFPEGTRRKGKSRGEMKIKPGSAMFAIKSGVAIIPVALEGSYKIFSRVRVIFGKPFYLDVDKNKKYTVEEMTQISRDIMDKVYSLMEAE